VLVFFCVGVYLVVSSCGRVNVRHWYGHARGRHARCFMYVCVFVFVCLFVCLFVFYVFVFLCVTFCVDYVSVST